MTDEQIIRAFLASITVMPGDEGAGSLGYPGSYHNMGTPYDPASDLDEWVERSGSIVCITVGQDEFYGITFDLDLIRKHLLQP